MVNKIYILVFLFLLNCSSFGELKKNTNSKSTGSIGFGISYEINENEFKIMNSSQTFIEFNLEKAFLSAGVASPKVGYRMAAFKFKESVNQFCKNQTLDKISSDKNSIILEGKLTGDCESEYKIQFTAIDSKTLNFQITFSKKELNRTFFSYKSDSSEQFFGFGEQGTHFNLKGKSPFIFTEEQGIGRGDQPITFGANVNAGAGGNEYTSYAPIPHYITSKNTSVFFENTSYSKFDLKDPDSVKVEYWENGLKGTIWKANSPVELLELYTAKTGRMPELPEWSYGTWLGVQGGEISVPSFDNKELRKYEKLEKIIEDAEKAGNPIAALWIQDWCGRRITGFGDQLKWRWYADDEMYPDLKSFIQKMNKKNIKVLGYINSFLADKDPEPNFFQKFKNFFTSIFTTIPISTFTNSQLEEAKAKGYLVKNKEGKDYLIQTVGFPAYLIDLSNPQAVKWTKEIIKKNMIEIGLSGWMADFGEWLPFDAIMHNGETGETYHNKYPVEWAKVNREAIAEAKKEGQIVFFTRAGYSYSNKYSTAFWGGDQMVSFQEHDGIASTVVELISGGMSGISINHSDIGGYTTIKFPWYFPFPHYYRSKELFLRWSELNAFTVLYRTHEGNRPKPNHQPYTDKETIEFFAKFGKIHFALKDYIKELVKEAKTKGLPVVRPLYLHYPTDKETYSLRHQFLLGQDLLMLPVVKKGADSVEGYLPEGEWEHLFTGKIYQGKSYVEVDAPIGTPAVFVKKGGTWSEKIKSSVRSVLK
jgi:alpha-glucosidase